jgi:hypothetical protein
MSDHLNPQSSPLGPTVYQIKIEGLLPGQWADWFGGVTLTPAGDRHTLLTGPVTDQAALYGLLKKVRDLGLPLVSVIRVDPGPAGASPVKE